MKQCIRDLFLWLFSVLGICTAYCRRKRRQGPLVRVLCLHDVSDTKWFEETIKMLLENYSVLSPASFHKQEYDSERINLLLTFDDGYQSWLDFVLPLLKKYELKALFFCNSGLLDIADDVQSANLFINEHLLNRPQKALSWEGARTLVAQGYTVGGHTVSHPNLVLLGNAEVKREIESDKQSLEANLGVNIIDFAYPFGGPPHFTEDTKKCAIDAGYSHIFSAVPGFSSSDSGNIPRTIIEQGYSMVLTQRFIEGGYDLFTICRSCIAEKPLYKKR
jgi:peptidoglycan/xylan/chitin deacetylase (PgdA/CDA1 family)